MLGGLTLVPQVQMDTHKGLLLHILCTRSQDCDTGRQAAQGRIYVGLYTWHLTQGHATCCVIRNASTASKGQEIIVEHINF